MLERCPKCGSDRLRDEVADFTVAQDGKSEVIKDRPHGLRRLRDRELTKATRSRSMNMPSRRRSGGWTGSCRAGPSPPRVRYRLKQTDIEQILSTGPKNMDPLGTRQDPAEQAGRQADPRSRGRSLARA